MVLSARLQIMGANAIPADFVFTVVKYRTFSLALYPQYGYSMIRGTPLLRRLMAYRSVF